MDNTGFVVILSMALMMWKFCSCFQFCIFTAPFHYVGFADFWVADQLNSLTTLLLDLEYLVCFYAVEVDWLGSNSKCTILPLGNCSKLYDFKVKLTFTVIKFFY